MLFHPAVWHHFGVLRLRASTLVVNTSKHERRTIRNRLKVWRFVVVYKSNVYGFNNITMLLRHKRFISFYFFFNTIKYLRMNIN